MSNLNFDVCLKHLYKILAEIYAFKLKVEFLEEAKNRLKLSINLHYGNKMVKTRNSKLSLLKNIYILSIYTHQCKLLPIFHVGGNCHYVFYLYLRHLCNCKPLLFTNIHFNRPVEDCRLAVESLSIINILNQGPVVRSPFILNSG